MKIRLQAANKASKREVHLRDYLVVFDRHKWIIILLTVLTLSSTVLYMRRKVPIYQAQASVIIEPKRPQEMVFQQSVQAISLDLETQIEVIKTDPVLGSVVKQLELTEAPEESVQFLVAVKQLRRNIKIGFVRNTKMVTITARHSDPIKAQNIANAVAQAYIDQDRLSRLHSARDSVRWLNTQLADLKTKLRNSEEAFQQFKEREGIITLDDKRGGELQEISKFKDGYLNARASRMEIEAIIDKLESENRIPGQSRESVDLSIPIALLNSPTLQKLGADLNQLETELADKKKLFKGTYPGIIELKERIQLIEQKILAELKRQRDFLKAQEDSFLAQQESKRREVLKLGKKELEYLSLEREVTSNREMYDTLLAKVKEFNVVGEADLNNIRIVELAQLPLSPVGNEKMTIALGGILGLLLGIGFAFFLEYMRNTIRTPDDVSQYLDLPTLGVVPRIRKAKRGKVPPIVVQDNSKSVSAEIYRSLRTNFLFSGIGNPKKAIMVTSVGPGEGKSLTVANLGATLAQTGREVLLVDGDMRRPMLHQIFRMDRHKGLSAVLAGELTVDEAIVKTDIPNLSVLASGAQAENTSELLGSPQMKELISCVRKQYDVVLFDSTPVLGMTDAVVLASETDVVVLVIKSGEATHKELRVSVSQIEHVGKQICGVVLNNVSVRYDKYYDYYHYYYSPYESKEDRKLRKRRKRSR
jgi:capsular exopolysaccharide synthesis family protein